MNKKRIVPILAALTLFSLCAGLVALSQDYGPDKIFIDNTTKATLRYLPVEFYHQKHNVEFGVACVTCHHTMEDDFVSGTPPVCGSCHNMDSEISFKDAMHRNCVVCHIEETAAGKSPPTECLECHDQRP
jgi:hypothetical protein